MLHVYQNLAIAGTSSRGLIRDDVALKYPSALRCLVIASYVAKSMSGGSGSGEERTSTPPEPSGSRYALIP
eukprot:3011937-Pyramimonas_sp.AAC.1